MNLLPLLTTYEYPRKIRLGNNHDGGYVIADLAGGYDGYISAGVGDDASFCAAFITAYQTMNNHAFDGTISVLPSNFPSTLTFVKKNIGIHENSDETNLSELLNSGKNLFLKMDIEGGEVPWLNQVSFEHLSHIKQLVIEFHGITDDSWGSSLESKISGLEKLTQSHRLVHIHGNNCGPMSVYEGVSVPAVVECTFVRATELGGLMSYNTESLPVPGLDFPNNTELDDYGMNQPPFVYSNQYETFER